MKTATLGRNWDVRGGPAGANSRAGPTGLSTRAQPRARVAGHAEVAYPFAVSQCSPVESKGSPAPR